MGEIMRSDLASVNGAGERGRSSRSAKSIRRVITTVMVGAALLRGVTLAGQAVRGETPVPKGAAVPRLAVRPSDSIGILDFYGLRTITQQPVRKALDLAEGDTVPQTASEAAEVIRRLEKVPGVARARLE